MRAVEKLAATMAALPQLGIELQHLKVGDLYIRVGVLPAGAVVTGAEHKTDHFSVVLGDVTLTTATGEVRRLTGFHVLPTHAGMQRAIYAHADTVMATLCRTTKATLADIEDDLVHGSAELQTRRPELGVNIKLEEISCSSSTR